MPRSAAAKMSATLNSSKADAVERLDKASSIDLGFPQDFIAMAREFVYGPVVDRFESRG